MMKKSVPQLNKINFKKNSLADKTILKNLKWKIISIIIFSFLSVIVISKLILETKIYIPGLFWISQTIVYQNEAQLDSWSKSLDIDLANATFFIICFFINVLLAIPAYFWIGKNFTKLSILCFFTWSLFGIILSLKAIQSEWQNLKIFNLDIKEETRTSKVSYYFIACFSGIVLGSVGSIIWRQNFTAGGIDFIYTYFATQKRKEIHKISLPISLIAVFFNILINESGKDSFDFINFLSLLIASMLFIQIRNMVINYLYPKYKIITVIIITKKKDIVVETLKKFYRHGGNIIETHGLYKNERKDIIITSMTYLEKQQVVKAINKIDKEAFFVGLQTNFIEGKFNFFNN